MGKPLFVSEINVFLSDNRLSSQNRHLDRFYFYFLSKWSSENIFKLSRLQKIAKTSWSRNIPMSVADPGFSWGGGKKSQSWCANLLFCRNYMNMKEFGPRGGVPTCRRFNIILDELDELDKTYGVMVVAVGKWSKHTSVLPKFFFVQFMKNFQKKLDSEHWSFP